MIFCALLCRLLYTGDAPGDWYSTFERYNPHLAAVEFHLYTPVTPLRKSPEFGKRYDPETDRLSLVRLLQKILLLDILNLTQF